MPQLFTQEFSKTYADLLKNVAPLEHRSDNVTESDYTLYPVLGESARKFNESFKIDNKAAQIVSPLKVLMKASQEPQK